MRSKHMGIARTSKLTVMMLLFSSDFIGTSKVLFTLKVAQPVSKGYAENNGFRRHKDSI